MRNCSWKSPHERAYIIGKYGEGEIVVSNLHQDEKTTGYFVAKDSDLGLSFYEKDPTTQQVDLTCFPGQLVVDEPMRFPYFETKRKGLQLFKTRRVLSLGRSKSWRDTCGEIQVFEKK